MGVHACAHAIREYIGNLGGVVTIQNILSILLYNFEHTDLKM